MTKKAKKAKEIKEVKKAKEAMKPVHQNQFLQDAAKHVKSLSKPLEEKTNIKLCSYNVGYDSNKAFYLPADLEFAEFRSKLDLPLPGTFLGAGVYFWDDILDQKHLKLFKEQLGVSHGMWLIKKHKGYREVFVFCTNEASMGNSYFANNLNVLENYSYYFKSNAQELIKKAQKEAFYLPENLVSLSKEVDMHVKLDLVTAFPAKKLMLDNQNKVYLTEREKLCFIYFLLGKTAKEIAELLQSSTKTVETHMRNVRLKLNCKNRGELLKKAWEMGILYSPFISEVD